MSQQAFIQSKSNRLKTANHTFGLNEKTLIMGILNVTPDSFSDGGKYDKLESAINHAQEMVQQGADILDVGGESTRPGAVCVPLEAELERILPVIKALKASVNVPISIDTYKAEVARQAVAAGADIINDVWGAKADPDMAAVAAFCDVPIILMHNRRDTNYTDFMKDMILDLQQSISIVKEAGVKDSHIILDPGIGFAKTYLQNLEALRRLDEITSLGYPVLLGTSRKSVIGKTLDLPSNQRVEGTGATVCLGIEKGCHIIRVHDVLEMSRMAKMMDAMLGKRRDDGG
jgi:dihydropteroate synthase